MAHPFKRIGQFFKRNAALILTVAGRPGAAAVVKAAQEAKAEVGGDGDPPPAPHVLQGGLTHLSIAVAAVAFLLQRYDLVPDGYSSEATAAVLVALGAAAYGRIRREWRK